jgi:hypothetical protein
MNGMAINLGRKRDYLFSEEEGITVQRGMS